MSKTQSQTNVEPIFKSDVANIHQAKAFKPSISDIISKIRKEVLPDNEPIIESVDHLVNEKEKADMLVGLNTLQGSEQQTALLNEMDPRNNRSYFEAGYVKWARDNSDSHTHLASIGSRVSFWLGSTFIANPASKGVPDYVWYLPKDRMTVFRGHFNPKTARLNKKHILATNKYLLIQREKIANRCATIFLIIGIIVGGSTWALHKASNGIAYVSNKVHVANEATKTKEEQLANLTTEAEAWVAKYKANEITVEQFKVQSDLLRQREKQINTQ